MVSSKTIQYNIEITIESQNAAPVFVETSDSDLKAIFKQYGITNTFVLPEIFDEDGDQVDVLFDVDECCTSWLLLSEDETEISLDLDSQDLIIGEYIVIIILTDGIDQTEYELVLDILEMESPYFNNWESNWEIEMLQNDANVIYQIPEFE